VNEAAPAAPVSPAWDCHVHVFDAAAPTLPGHYRPATRTLAEIEALAGAHGVQRLVLVQPSVYGTDHRVLLAALRGEPGRHRGVAVLTPEVSGQEIDELHAGGVRGVRFNCVSPAGEAGIPADAALALAARVARRGWFLQWYVHAHQLARLAELQARCETVFVLDHLAGLHAGLADGDAAWDHLATLAAGGAWLKLSGWYRLGAPLPPYAELHTTITRAAALFDDRLLWGSDWPHTSLPDPAALAYAATWWPVAQGLPGPQAAQVRGAFAARMFGC
jgi:predicted TIM-barrel fold metal-dependent hydrolase